MTKKKKILFSFTIIELLMAISVFTFVVLSALGIYTTTIQKHYEAQKIQIVVEELRWPMEVMAKDIKRSWVMGKSSDNKTIYLAPTDESGYENCAQGNINDSNCLTYRINLTANQTKIEVRDPKQGDTVFSPLTSSKIEILSGSQFYIDAKAPGEANYQWENPKVTILIKAQAVNDPKKISEITLQTTATQNDPENHYQGIK